MPENLQQQAPVISGGNSGSPIASDSQPSTLGSQPPPHIPDHDLFHRIGRGSYGEVWLARNIIGAHHAIKIIHRSAFENERPFEREFEGIKKAMPVSRSIPGLVHILQVGRNDDAGYFYYVMELADSAEGENEKGGKGEEENNVTSASSPSFPSAPLPLFKSAGYTPRTLSSDLKRRGPLPVEECVQLGLTLTAALRQLHEQGLVHRDIKPSNIIFVNGAPKLADIGLMAGVSDARSFVGTAGFIPPEGPGTPQADLYSLGKVLYEISTGKDRQDFPELPAELIKVAAGVSPAVEPGVPPGGPGDEDADRVGQGRPNPGGKMPPSTAGGTPAATALLELNSILVKACDNDFRKRYQTAQQMHDDLALLQRGKSVRHQRAVKRRVAFTKIVGGVAILAALLFAGVGFISNRQIEQKRVRRQEAQTIYQEGRSFVNRQTKDAFTHAVNLFHQAIAIDPNYAPAYVGLADAHYSGSGWDRPPREAMPMARWAAQKALEIDNRSAEAHVWLARVKFHYDWDWAGAEAEFKRGIRLKPKNGTAHECYATFLAAIGRAAEARAEMELSEPYVQLTHRACYSYGMLFYFDRQYDKAIEQAVKGLALESNSVLNHFLLMDCYLMKAMYSEAIAEAHALRELDDSPSVVAELGYLYAVTGRTDEARQYLAQLERDSTTRYVSAYFRGFIHLGLGEKDKALTCLEQAYHERFSWMGNLKVEPGWDGLRAEPRFIALLRKMGLGK